MELKIKGIKNNVRTDKNLFLRDSLNKNKVIKIDKIAPREVVRTIIYTKQKQSKNKINFFRLVFFFLIKKTKHKGKTMLNQAPA